MPVRDILYLALTAAVLLLTLFLIPVLRNLASTIKSANKMLTRVDNETVEILKKVQISLDEINKELTRVDEIVADVQVVTDKVESTARLLSKVVSTPVVKISAYATGIADALSSLKKGRKEKGKVM